MIRKALYDDLTEIKDIICEAFGMSLVDCNNMLDMIDPLDNTFVYVIGREVVSVASAIEFCVNSKKGRYIYAVATKKTQRKKGFAGELLSYIKDYYREIDVIMLRPANESLFDYYKKLGFIIPINADTVQYAKRNATKEITELVFDEYFDLRGQYNDFSFPAKVREYYVSAYEYKAVATDDAVALYRKDNDVCFVDEIYGNGTDELVYAVIAAENAENAMVIKPGNGAFALAHYYNEEFNIDFRIPME